MSNYPAQPYSAVLDAVIANGGATTDASLLVSGTLADARLSSNVALENTANTFTAKQSFSGSDHVGLCLNSLTTAQYNALTPANGDLFRDSTTDRIDARLARGTVELVDTAGGQTIGGNLAATTLMVGGSGGPQWRNNSGAIEARNNANSARVNVQCLSVIASGTNSGGSMEITGGAGSASLYFFPNSASVTGILYNPANGVFQFTNGSATSGACFSFTTDNLVTVRNRANSAAGDMSLGNLTASGTLRVGGGTPVTSILSATATLDFPSIASNDTHTLTITVTGAVAGDSVFLGVPAGLDAGLIFCASVTAANTVTVRMHNSSGGSVDPASGLFRATVIRF